MRAGAGTGTPIVGHGRRTNGGVRVANRALRLVMKAFGGDGETIERPDEVRPAIERALASRVPYCLNVQIRGARSPFTEWQIAGKKR